MSTPVDYDSIAELNRLGYSAAHIAERVGCNKRTVQRWRASVGIAQPVPEFAFERPTPERLEAARRMLAEGASQYDTAITLRMSTQTLRKYFPGQAWTRQQSGALAQMVRQLNRLEAFA